MNSHSITFSKIDNLFTTISDFDTAQQLSNSFSPEELHVFLDSCVKEYCPFIEDFGALYHWSIMQAEYATDIIFSSKDKLAAFYEHASRTVVLAVKAENITTFLGRKLHPNYQDEMGNNFNTRIEGTRIRHTMGPTSIKAYDKLGVSLRIETTTNNVSFFKHYRDVKKKDGTIVNKIAQMRKSIYSIADLAKVLLDANCRYIEYLASLDDPTDGVPKLEKLSKTVTEHNHPYKGFNFFSNEDLAVLITIARGEFNISGFQNENLRMHLSDLSTSKATRLIKRLRVHGIIRKVRGSHRYLLTKLGKQVVSLGVKLKEFFIIPNLALCN